MADKQDKKPPLPKPKATVKKEANDEEDFTIENLCERTAGLSVIRERSRECSSSPFGCPMSPKWEIWLKVKVKANKDCLIRTG